MHPKTLSVNSKSSQDVICKVISFDSALVLSTANVCGNIFSDTKNTFALFLTLARGRELKNINIASAAAVPSSSKDEFAIGKPVRSDIIV